MTRTLAWGLLLLLASLAMALTPLFALLGFESSLVLALLAALAAAHLGAGVVRARRLGATPADGDLAEARPLRAVYGLLAAAQARALGLLVLPLLVLLANALRVRNCNFGAGFAWYLLLPVLSSLTGATAGIFAGLAGGRRGGGLAIAVVFASIAWGLARFYFAPPIFAFDPFVGYFPGSLYDEELAIPATLFTARALHLLGVAAAVALAAALLDGRALRLRWRPRAPGLAALALALLVAFAFAHRATRRDLSPDAASLAAALGARRDTPHLTLLYSRQGPWAREIDLVAEDAEFRWSQLATTFGVAPRRRVTAYLFDSSADKRRLLGASQTQIAKPWRREIYLQYEPWPHPVIKHELAHVFAGEFGDPIFGTARRDVRFNVGLIEGAAVAADARPEPLTLDQQVKIMRQLGIMPRLETILGIGFLGQSSARAYTVAGSFCRFLLDTRGAERFRALYRSGGDFAAAYGAPLSTLEAEWTHRLDETQVSIAERAQSRERLERPGVFHKVCAHELALRRDEARGLQARGDHEAAVARLRSVCGDDPADAANLVDLMAALALAGRDDEAAAVATQVRDHQRATPGQRARALLQLGDGALREDARERARAAYAAIALTELDANTARQVRIRLAALDDAPFPRALARYLVGERAGQRDAASDLLLAERLAVSFPSQPLGHYLAARQLFAHNRFAEAEAQFGLALVTRLDDEAFALEARRLSAIAAFRDQRRQQARASFITLLVSGAPPQVAAEARDFVARCEFTPPR